MKPPYNGLPLQRTPLQQQLFYGTDEMTIKLSLQNLYVTGTLWRTLLYTIEYVVFRSQFTLPPITNLFLAQ